MSGYFDSRNAMIKAIKNGEIEITRDGNTYTVTGNTYAHKDFIKRELEAKWDKDAKCWRTVDARQGVIDLYDELMPQPEPETADEPSTTKSVSVTLNDDGSINLSNGAIVEMDWNGGDIDVTVYNTPQAASHEFGWNHRLFTDNTKPSIVSAWMVERGVDEDDAKHLGNYFLNIARFHR